jgi:hypothetical protein
MAGFKGANDFRIVIIPEERTRAAPAAQRAVKLVRGSRKYESTKSKPPTGGGSWLLFFVFSYFRVFVILLKGGSPWAGRNKPMIGWFRP